MVKRGSRMLVAVLVSLALAVPVLGAIDFAYHEATSVVTDRARLYARQVIERSNDTTDQVNEAVTALAIAPDGQECSSSQLQQMRRIDVASSYLQAVGHVGGDSLICSSIDSTMQPIPLGPADITSPSGVKIRTNVHLPFIRSLGFLVIQRGAYAAIVHKSVPLDVAAQRNGVALGLIALPSRTVLDNVDQLNPDWLRQLPGKNASRAFVDHGRGVAITTSDRYFLAAVVALPASDLNTQFFHQLREIVPLGVLVGIALALAVIAVSRSRGSTASRLRSGMRRNEFFAEYQPIVSLVTREVVGAEVLLRWRRPDGLVVSPDVFIPAAESTGMIMALTDHMFAVVARDAANLFRAHPRFQLSVNLSADDLHDPALVDRLSAFAAAMDAPHNRVVVEVTERVFVQPDLAVPIMTAVRDHGFQIAIDDFGTGYSGLAALQRFALDHLKIDKSFVETLGTDAPTSHVVFHIIDIAASLGLTLIAEGVEREDQAIALTERRVTFAQGWLFGRPTALADVLASSTMRTHS